MKRTAKTGHLTTLVFLLCLVAFAPSVAWAGPPFLTDDPEPVEYKHVEINAGALYAYNRGGYGGAAPFFEANYGIVPDVQLHMIVPVAFDHANEGPTTYGPGDLELGVKYRFIHETDIIPQLATFVITQLPAGDSDRGLGSGHVPLFLPIWVQKSFGPWTVYGGGGYWLNPGAGKNNYWQTGGVVQREINKTLTLGAELFHFTSRNDSWILFNRAVPWWGGVRMTTARMDFGHDRTGYNIGGIVNLSDEHHVLFSAGSDISGNNRMSAYLAYQWTFGPHEEKK